MLNSQDLKKKVGQLLVIGFDGKVVSAQVKSLIQDYHIGGIILFGRNIGTPEEILILTTELQSEAKAAGYQYPLLICVDQENGVVRRLGKGTTIFPGAMTLGATGDPENAYKIGIATGKELKALGINWNLAPVLDVNNNQENPVIGVRSFGESAEKVSEFGREAMRGMQEAGIATTLKHFPGHGDTNIDSHLDLPIITHSKERLNEVELLPFKTAIKTGADTIMTAHVYFPAIESEVGIPATLSNKVITGLLREELGFSGVVTTDCMEMEAIANGIGTEKGGVKAVKAGVDLVMVSHTEAKQVGTIREIIRAIENGEISEEAIEQSIARINELKRRYLHWGEIDSKQKQLNLIGSNEHKRLAHEVYKKGITIVKNNDVLPITVTENSSILVIHPDNGATMKVEDKSYANLLLGEIVSEYHLNVDVQQFTNDLTKNQIETIIDQAHSYDFVILGTLTIMSDSKQIDLVEKLNESEIPFVVVAMRSPYDLTYLPDVSAYINTYEFTYPALKAAVGAIFGKEKVSGKLPITVNAKMGGKENE